jgi:hypothetical protein
MELFGLTLLGLAVGTFGTLIGAGGGFLLVPILLLMYPNDDPATITSVSLAVVFLNARRDRLPTCASIRWTCGRVSGSARRPYPVPSPVPWRCRTFLVTRST